jgi:hypothetical protein
VPWVVGLGLAGLVAAIVYLVTRRPRGKTPEAPTPPEA